ncbi:hypothetical protein [Desulfosarcina cetonica]
MTNTLMAFLSGLTGVFFSPYWIVKGWTNFFFRIYSQDGRIISFTRKNSINDHTGMNTIQNWMLKYGYWGVNFENNGRPLHLSYPPLTYYLIRFLGLRYMFIVGQFLFVIIAGYMLIANHPAFLMILPVVFCSPFYKNHVIVCGRYDFIGFCFYMIMMIFFSVHSMVLGSLMVIPMSLIHPTLALLGWITIAIKLLFDHVTKDIFIGVLFLHAIMVFFWLYPFMLSFNLTAHHKHSWSPPGYSDKTRSNLIIIKKTLPYFIFVIYFYFTYKDFEYLMMLSVPIIFEISEYFKRSLMNRFSVDLLKAIIGLFCICAFPSPTVIGLYIFFLYFYASPSSRNGFDLDVIFLKDADLFRIIEFFGPISNKKTLIVSFVDDGEKWRQEGKIVDICNMINSYRDTPSFINWFHTLNGNDVKTDEILDYAKYMGSEYFIFTKKPPFSINFADFVSTITLPNIGDVPSCTLKLYKIKDSKSIIEPSCEYTISRNIISLIVEKGVQYTVKFMGCRGWRGIIDDVPVRLKGDRNTIRFVAPKSGRIKLKFSYLGYFSIIWGGG